MAQHDIEDDWLDNPLMLGDKPRIETQALQSKVTEAFEAAIEQGMPPIDALATILFWISSEMARIQTDQIDRPS